MIKSVDIPDKTERSVTERGDQKGDKSVSSAPASVKGSQVVPKIPMPPKTESPDHISPVDPFQHENYYVRSLISSVKPFSWRENAWDNPHKAKFLKDTDTQLQCFDFFYENKRIIF